MTFMPRLCKNSEFPSSVGRTEHGLVLNWSSPICVERCPVKGSTIFCPEGLEVSEKEELQPGAGSMCDQVAFAFKGEVYVMCFLLATSGKQLPHKII